MPVRPVAASFAAGPYQVPNAQIDAYVTYTNNPPCGAMRGFGAVMDSIHDSSRLSSTSNCAHS